MKRRSSALPWLNLGVMIGLGAAYYAVLRPRMLTFGASPEEALAALPGDDLIPAPAIQATRAVTIQAPIDIIWPWIAQMGRDRTGFYGLDNLSNHGLPSAAYLRQDLPIPESGLAMDQGYQVLQLDPPTVFLYGRLDHAGRAISTKLLWLESIKGGVRLLIRTRIALAGPGQAIYGLAYEVIDFLETFQQLQNIRQRAEVMKQLTGR